MTNLKEYTAVFRSLDLAGLSFLASALLLYYASTIIYAFRWRIVLGGMGERIPLRDLLRMILSSIFINNITPTARGGGELLRVLWLSRKHGISTVVSTASIVYERLTEAVPISLLVLVSISFFARDALYLMFFVLTMIFFVWIKWESLVELLARLITRKSSQEELVKLISLRKDLPLNLSAVGLSSGVWLLDVLRLKMITSAFGWDPGWGFVAVISLAILVCGLIPFTPGGVGLIEGGMLGALTLLGAPLTVAIPVTLIERLVSYITSSFVGFFVLITSGGFEIWRISRSH